MKTRVSILWGAMALFGLVGGTTLAQVTGAAITLDPISGPAKTEVMAAGTGFAEASCGVNLYLDATDGTLLATAELNQGAFTATFVVPDDATIGEHAVIAAGLDLDGDDCTMASGEEASAPFTVEEPLPTVTLDPATGPPASIFFVRGESFDADSCGVDLYLDSESGLLLGSAAVSGGEFVREIQIPGDTAVGDHDIIAIGLGLEDEACSMMTGEQASATYGVVEANPGPFVSEAVIPFEQDIDLTDLVTITPWSVGDPVRMGPGQGSGDEAGVGISAPNAAAEQEIMPPGKWPARVEREKRGTHGGSRATRTPEDKHLRATPVGDDPREGGAESQRLRYPIDRDRSSGRRWRCRPESLHPDGQRGLCRVRQGRQPARRTGESQRAVDRRRRRMRTGHRRQSGRALRLARRSLGDELDRGVYPSVPGRLPRRRPGQRWMVSLRVPHRRRDE